MKFQLSSILAVLFISTQSFAMIYVNPMSIFFGQVKVGQSSMQTVSVTNQSNKPQNLFINPGCFGDIQISSGCGYIGAYSSCTIFVNFYPSRVGSQSCYINISGPEGATSVSVSGAGVQ